MPLIDLQVRLRELGRIRTGVTVEAESQGGKKFRRPEKLATFRLTSPSRPLIDAAAEIYGPGEVVPWDSPAGAQWELITKVDVLPIVIPSGEALSQWYEMWKAGGCERRCDGRTETLSDGPCLCPADPAERRELAAKIVPEACKPTTRLNVVLPDLPDLGVWRLESHGYYAAVELAGAAQFLAMASARGMNIPARLRLEQREKKVPGQRTNRYAVPVIEFATTRIQDLLDAGAGPMMLGETEQPAAPMLAPGSLTPAKAKRERGTKVERPALGPAPEVPDGAGFGRQRPVQAEAPTLPTASATEAPAAAEPATVPKEPAAAEQGAGVAPDTEAGGWPVMDDLPPPPVTAPKGKAKPTPPPPLSAEDLKGLIVALPEADRVTARAVFERRFPNVKNLAELDDAARGRYWQEFTTTQQGASSAA